MPPLYNPYSLDDPDEEIPYEPPPVTPPPPPDDIRVVPGPGGPPPTGTTPTPTPFGGGGGGGFTGMPPAYPNFNIPGAPQFVPPSWRAPTQQEALNEPGYAFRVKSGSDALERSAAARGMLRGGNTLTDVLKYGQDFAAQEYGNVYNRALGAYDRQYKGAYDAFAPLFERWRMGADASKQAQLARYQSQLSQWMQSQQPRPQQFIDPGPPPTPPDVNSYGGGDPWTDNVGDPWTEEGYY